MACQSLDYGNSRAGRRGGVNKRDSLFTYASAPRRIVSRRRPVGFERLFIWGRASARAEKCARLRALSRSRAPQPTDRRSRQTRNSLVLNKAKRRRGRETASLARTGVPAAVRTTPVAIGVARHKTNSRHFHPSSLGPVCQHLARFSNTVTDRSSRSARFGVPLMKHATFDHCYFWRLFTWTQWRKRERPVLANNTRADCVCV